MKQNETVISFTNEDSWTILSSIEQSIKNKIEAIGIPLKDWNININYGIKTGYNEAFIIDSAKRQEILNNCSTEEERNKTDAIIRPILRGRDIKQYSYDWMGLYLIATFPSRNYDINQYPALKEYLLTFGQQKLAQTGEKNINGILNNNARKKTNNEWFETQDSINYWEDFSKPKIMYPNMTKYMPFYYDEKGFYQNDKSFMITGEHVSFLTAFLNSSLFKFCFSNSFPELQGGTRELRKIFFDKIPVIKVSDEVNTVFKRAVTEIQNSYSKEQAIHIDNMIFDLYNLSDEERKLIGYIEIE
ncbi:MAG TPA: type II restriction endonuclease [Candidatus Ornithospirochaeta stercorigallinarum]|nr:type II restriction endonuclease [Candidatus Ornithospirochaeta stercorigallinarum]